MVVGGLVFLPSAVLAGHVDRLILLQCLYRLDLRYWFPAFAYPLWLMVAFLAFDAITSRQRRTDTVEPGKWRRRFDTAIIAIKSCLIILIAYFSINMCVPFREHWFWWYPANLFLLGIFLTNWFLIYKTRSGTNFTQDILNVRKRFLAMSLTVTGELGIYNVLLWTGLLNRLYYSLWTWFGLGVYSHLAVLTFFLICLAIGITSFVLKEWLAAIRQARKANREGLANNHQQSE